jgi:hypothetical protein
LFWCYNPLTGRTLGPDTFGAVFSLIFDKKPRRGIRSPHSGHRPRDDPSLFIEGMEGACDRDPSIADTLQRLAHDREQE